MREELRLGDKSASTISNETAMQLAAAAWCGEKTKNKVMDPELAFEFAKILQREVNLRLMRDRLIHKSFSTEGKSMHQSVDIDGDADKVYRMTSRTFFRFPPECISYIKIGESHNFNVK